jgi:hypothetical protein
MLMKVLVLDAEPNLSWHWMLSADEQVVLEKICSSLVFGLPRTVSFSLW